MKNSTKVNSFFRSRLNAVFVAGLVAGTLDILAAFLQTSINLQKVAAEQVLRFIASGVFGNSAFSGGNYMIILGLLFHYIIAFGFTIFYFLLYSKLPKIKSNKIFASVAYGLFVWFIMNLIVVPLSQTPEIPFSLERALKGIVILIVCVGFPITIMAGRYYDKKNI